MTALATIIGRGLHSARPAAGTPGSIYYETDTSTLFRDNGASWDNIEAAGATGTAGGDLTGTYPSPTLDLTKAHIWTAKQEVSAFRITPGGATGAPTSGAHVIGEMYIDSAGTTYVCTAGGTPGTWSAGGGGSSTLAGDTDVSISSPAQGHVLGYNGSAWTNVGGMQRISSQTLVSTAASITFSSIPGTYKHLLLVAQQRGTTATTALDAAMQFNGDTGANYLTTRLYNNSSSTAASLEATGQTNIVIGGIPGSSAGANAFGDAHITIPNYAGSNDKGIVYTSGFITANSAGGGSVQTGHGAWFSTAVITSITVFPTAGSYAAGTIFTLYGVS
jgi:hypothetical protein